MSNRAPFEDSSEEDERDDEKSNHSAQDAPAPETQPESTTSDKEEPEEPVVKKEDNATSNNTQSSSRLVIGDDSEDEGGAEFDDGGDIIGSSAPADKPSVSKSIPIDRQVDDGEGDVERPPSKNKIPKPPQRAEVLEAERPSDGVSFHMTKLPNLVGIQPEAFDQESYVGAAEEEQYRGYVHNMIRWRYKRDDNGNVVRDDEGSLVRESNSRLVKWNDGSYTLHIGNESFEVDAVNSAQGDFAGLNGFIYLSQKATFSTNGDEEDPSGGTGTVLECMGSVKSRLVARPSSLQSEAHKSLTVAVRQRTIKRARIAQYVTQEDPEKAKAARIRHNEDTEKIQSRKRSHYRATASRHRSPGMNRRYLEENDEAYDSINIRALKKRSGDDEMDDYGEDSDSDDDYDETFRGRNARKRPKKEEEEEEEEEEELVFDEESDEDDITHLKAHKKKRSHQAVLEDDDDED